jgi:hypothetical protein
VFSSLTSLRKIVAPLTVLGVVVSVVSYYLYSPALVSWLIAVPVVITVLVGLLSLSRKTVDAVPNKAVFIGVLSIMVFSLQFLVCPSAIGQAFPVDSVARTGAIASACLAISAVGALLLAVMLVAYIAVVGRADRGRPPDDSHNPIEAV